jgi:hypothetical protein
MFSWHALLRLRGSKSMMRSTVLRATAMSSSLLIQGSMAGRSSLAFAHRPSNQTIYAGYTSVPMDAEFSMATLSDLTWLSFFQLLSDFSGLFIFTEQA